VTLAGKWRLGTTLGFDMDWAAWSRESVALMTARMTALVSRHRLPASAKAGIERTAQFGHDNDLCLLTHPYSPGGRPATSCSFCSSSRELE
jgi:hypothetical protein